MTRCENEPLVDLAEIPLERLVAEVEARTVCPLDLGLSAQVCPKCSTAKSEHSGEYSRAKRSFSCLACGLRLSESRYEHELDRFERQRWRARREVCELGQLAREST